MTDSVCHVPPILMALQTEILSTETSDFFIQIFFSSRLILCFTSVRFTNSTYPVTFLRFHIIGISVEISHRELKVSDNKADLSCKNLS